MVLPSSSTPAHKRKSTAANESDANGKKAKLSSGAGASAAASASSSSHAVYQGCKDSRNGTVPSPILLPSPTLGCVKLAAWNIVSYASSMKKYIKAENADLIILCETKTSSTPANMILRSLYPHQAWSHSETKGYAGTAILSKYKPLSKSLVLPTHPDPASTKGRIVTLEFENCWVVGTYVPNSGLGKEVLRAAWDRAFVKYVRQLEKSKPVIWGGDMNVVASKKDIHPKDCAWGKDPGSTDAERAAFDAILNPPPDSGESRYVDSWRHIPKYADVDGHYTYFSMRISGRGSGVGWRLDAFVIAEALLPRLATSEIRYEIYGASDHVPVVLELTGSL